MSIWRLASKSFWGRMKYWHYIASLFFVAGIYVPIVAMAFETGAKQAILLDYDTGFELYSKNADELMSPASMTKMMTVYLLFERLREGRLSLQDELLVSRKAWRKGGSKMFVEAGERVSVEDLLRGIVIQSGNDATIVVAEGLSANEEAFAREMTEKARDLGMNNTTFKNASGWPDPEHKSSARDLAILAEASIRNFPEMYRYYAERDFSFSGIKQQNRNPLLGRFRGADGLKTGYTEKAGYGLTASASKNGRRLILVLNGLPSQRARKVESQRMLNWGFREFKNYQLFKTNENISKAEVWLGEATHVSLLAKEGVLITLEKSKRKDLQVRIRHKAPISAPIKKGIRLGEIVITVGNRNPMSIPVIAGEDVGRLGPVGRLSATLNYLLWGISK